MTSKVICVVVTGLFLGLAAGAATNALPGVRGQAKPFVAAPKVKANLAKYSLKAYTYVASSNEAIPFVVFTPKRVPGKVKYPVIMFLHGLGERGTDLDLFQCPYIFSCTMKAMQDRFPCYIFAAQHPDNGKWFVGDHSRSPSLELAMEALAWLCAHASPSIDRNRIYITGGSSGGWGTYDAVAKSPGVFAAAIPISTPAYSIETFNSNNVCRFWHVINRAEMPKQIVLFDAFGERIKALGGEFRLSAYERRDHDAWSWAYSEMVMWEWVFAQSREVKRTSFGAQKPKSFTILTTLPACTARSNQEADGFQTPDRAIDGLTKSQFVSLNPARRGDYVRVDFAKPLSSTFLTVLTGYENGSDHVVDGRVDVSTDGKQFKEVAPLKKGVATVKITQAIKSLRVIALSNSSGPLVVREIAPARPELQK